MMPRWRKDGRELYYLSNSRQLMSVEIKAGATLETGAVKTLFQTAAALSLTNYSYSVTGDGQKFLIREPANSSNAGTVEPIQVVINWPAALGR